MFKLNEHILGNAGHQKTLSKGLSNAFATVVYVDLVAGDDGLLSMMYRGDGTRDERSSAGKRREGERMRALKVLLTTPRGGERGEEH